MLRRERLGIVGASVLALALLSLHHLDHTVDDAFIGFRYAENLIRGHGLVFNPGERVEGYTNFLWVLLLAPCLALSIDPEVASKVLGFIAAAATLAAVVRLGSRTTRFRESGWVAPLFLASSPPFVVWATGGMETPLFTCFVTWSAALALEGMERGVLGAGVGLLLGASALTRPEGAGVAAVLGGLTWALGPRTPEFRRSCLRCAATFLLIFIPYFLWRWWYYARLLPNTFYAKVGASPAQVFRGLYYAHVFFAFCGYWLLLPLIGLRWSARRRAALLLGGLTLALLGYVIAIGGDALPMFRFFTPLLPAFFLLLAMGTDGILERLGGLRHARAGTMSLLVLVAIFAARVGITGPLYEEVRRDSREVSAWKEIGAWLRDHAPRDATIAVIPAGAIPFVSKLRTIDMLGLNDATIAHRDLPQLGSGLPGHEKFDVDYVLSRRPDVILLGVYGLEPEPRPPWEMIHYYYEAEWRMLDSKRFGEEYRILSGRTPGGYFPFFARSVPPASAPAPLPR
jgi:arabinofuranosyltransferase